MKCPSMWPAGLLLAGSAVFAQVASEPAEAGKVWPAIQKESASVRERLENAMAQRKLLRTHEQAINQTRRQIRAENQAQNRIRSVMRMQESLIDQDRQALHEQERDSPTLQALQQQMAQHQQLLELLRSQDEQLMRVQAQLQAQQEAQQQRRDQVRVR